jgi:hypothetical protein
MAELSIAFHVLIHINHESLNIAYELLYSLSRRFILISEYFNPTPVAIPYRGHENRLFKRDFAGEIWAQYPSLKLVDYGFVWSKDPIAPKDDTTWFLFEKKCSVRGSHACGSPPRAFLECVPVDLAPGIQLRFGAQVSPESLVVTAKEPSRFNGSDQLSQGAA